MQIIVGKPRYRYYFKIHFIQSRIASHNSMRKGNERASSRPSITLVHAYGINSNKSGEGIIML